MDFERYKNTMTYPSKPSRPKEPKLKGNENAEGFRAHAGAMDKFAIELKAWEDGPYKEWKEQYDAYYKESARLQDLFKADLLEELGLTGHPKADQFYDVCYERGHSGGFSDIASIADDIARLMHYTVDEMQGLIKFRGKNGIRN